ncbi:tetratricopeptide repeat protein [Bacillus massiliigorillae]|uniref:tetratricopeptide repeat protein n=1 Tax=Bacillus massiliigorillae TaxID=1243664 RepID=UPI00039D176D|nr:tetratricopeptide repeat protein [Bacillus massiliigorillae]
MKLDEIKLKVPNYSPYIIRNRLFQAIEYHPQLSLISVVGDGGYGKTTLVSSYIQENNIPTVWYQLNSSDQYVQIFTSHLKAGLYKEIYQNISGDVIEPNSIEEEIEIIIQLLSKREQPLFIVLDDYQWVDQSPEIETIIHKILAHCSSAVTFIIISRVQPHLSTTKLKLEKRYKELTTSDLAFTLEETKEFFNTMNGLLLEHQELLLIFKRTEGWIASYQLLLEIINKMNVVERSFFWSEFPKVQDIYDYLSTEVLEAQGEEIKDFLYRTSLLSELDEQVIDQFLNINHSKSILKQLLKQHLFIYRDEQGYIRYHNLFRQFLYQKYKELVHNDVIVNEHLKLAVIYEERYQFVYAFAHSTIGNDYVRATKLMGLISNRYNPVESIVLLDGWLEEICLGESLANNTLFLIRCIPLTILKELTVHFEENIAMLKKENNELWLCNLQHRLATIYLMRGDVLKAKHLFLESLKGSERFHNQPMSALNLNLIGEIYRYFGEYEKALQYVRKALFISDRIGNKHTQLHALDTIATIYLDQNKIDETVPHIEQALDMALQYDLSSLIFVYPTLSRTYRKKGELEQSIEWGKKATFISENNRIDFDIGWSNLELGKSYCSNNQWKEAEECLSKAYRAFSLHTYYKCWVISAQIILFIRNGNSKLEKLKRMELMQLCEEHDYHWIMEPSHSSKVVVKEEMKRELMIQTLGTLKILYQNTPVVIKRNASLRLFQYFITYRNKKIDKDLLLEEVFPDGDLRSLQNQFHVSLSVLRKSLEPNLISGIHSRYVKRLDNHYQFNTAEVSLDVDRFQVLTTLVGDEFSPGNIQRLLEAEQVYQGDFFEEYPYEIFLEPERNQLQSTYMKAMTILARYYYQQCDYSKCFEYFEKILRKDPYHETGYFEYIELLLKQNLVSQANKIAKKMIQLVEKELGVHVRDTLLQIFLQCKSSPTF